MSVRARTYLIVLIFLSTVLIPATLTMAGHEAPASNGRIHSLIHDKAVPGLLNYQGHLADAADTSAVTATLEMTFRLFDSETKGAELWSETQSAIEVNDGLFQVLLGSVTAFPAGLFDGTPLWLQTEVGTEVLSPRKPLASVAFSQTAGEAGHAAAADQADNAVEAQHAGRADTADVCPGISAWTVNGDNVYRATGNVGIGTASPSYPLDVTGAVNATTYYGDGSNLTGISGTADTDWTINGDTVYHETGPVGIGTTTPTALLTIQGSSGDEIFFAGTSNNVDIKSTMSMRIGTNSGHGVGLITNNLYRMLVNGDGNVGIGTISPQAKLHVDDDTGIYALYARSADTTAIVGITEDSTDYSYGGYFAGHSHHGGGVYGISAQGTGVYGLHTDSGPTSPGVYGHNLGSGAGVLGRATQYQGVYGISNTGESVYAYNTFSGIYSYLADTVWAGYFSGDAHISGNVGIGTTTPGTKLEVSYDNLSSTTPAITINNSNSSGQDAFDFQFAGTTKARLRIAATGGFHIGTLTYSDLNLRTDDTIRLHITPGGLVGIGTITPVSLLEVEDVNPDMRLDASVGGAAYLRFSQDDDQQATVKMTANGDLQLDTKASGAAGITILNSNANVGIGTETPARTLHVGDAMRLEPTTAPSSPQEGDMYMDSTTHKLMVYDGTTWQACW